MLHGLFIIGEVSVDTTLPKHEYDTYLTLLDQTLKVKREINNELFKVGKCNVVLVN